MVRRLVKRTSGHRGGGRTLAWAGAALLPLALAVGVWQLVTTTWLQRSRVYPTPVLVWNSLRRIATNQAVLGSAYADVASTLERLFIAFAIAFVVGSLLGVLAGRYEWLFDLLQAPIWAFLAIPAIVWVFIFAVAIGLSDTVPIAAVVALVAPGVLLNVSEGTKSVSADLRMMAASYRVRGWRLVWDVYLPALVPYLLGAARVAFALGVKIIPVAEVIGLASGIGYELNYWYAQLLVAPIVAWGVVLIVVGVAMDYLFFGPLERRLTRWQGSHDTRKGS
ncbi:MAG: ABC transporter permease [Nocardioidaceae bacterium]